MFSSVPSTNVGDCIANEGLSKFDDFDRLVLADLALKGALLRTGLVRLYSSQPHRRPALGARWMYRCPVNADWTQTGAWTHLQQTTLKRYVFHSAASVR